MRPHSSPPRLLALAALACCSGTAHADDAFDHIDETMEAAFQLTSMNPDDGLYLLANGTMQSGDVVTGVRHGTGEQAMLVIEESISTVERIGLSDDDPVIGTDGFREHVRQLHGTLIGTEARAMWGAFWAFLVDDAGGEAAHLFGLLFRLSLP